MKRILLTTTSLVLAAGVAQADITWSGSATAGLARDGKTAAKAALTTLAASGVKHTVLEKLIDDGGITATTYDPAGTDPTQTEIDAARAALVALAREKTALGTAAGDTDAKAANKAVAGIDYALSASATAAGKMTQYSEVNATASASVATDMGWVISGAISVDAGTGYDFADDDGFDAAKTNGVGLDSVSIDFGAGGKLTLDQNAVAHLVDADDDAAADLLYTNTFGTASFSVAADIDDGDSDHNVTAAAITTAGAFTAASAAADVQWSAKVSMPLAGTNVYFAADEEGGDAYGVSGTYAGLGWSVDSKREAAEKDANKDRSNTVGVSYATGALTLGATYNSIKDGDQWGVSAAYAAGALTMNLSTDEGSDWSASGAYDLGNGASLVGGTNYTEDAYVGVSFAF